MRNPDPQFWRGRRVFITGHTGFKGGWLATWLKSMGAILYGYALTPPTNPNFFSLCDVTIGIEQEFNDIRDLGALQAAMSAFRPDIVLHLAAQPIVRYSFQAPVETYAVNVIGTVNLLEAVRHVGSVRATLIITSDKCYENREIIWAYREGDSMGGFDPYSSSKGCAELVAAAYARSFFSAEDRHVGSVRAGNVIGGGDWAKDRLITDIVTALTREEKPIIRRPKAVRPWQHVLEPLSGYLIAAEYLWAFRKSASSPMLPTTLSWNFGPGTDSEVDVETVVGSVCRLWGDKATFQIVADPDAPHEAAMLKLDSTKARHELDWRPRWGLQAALKNTVEWYKHWHSGHDMTQLTMEQIRSYEAATPDIQL